MALTAAEKGKCRATSPSRTPSPSRTIFKASDASASGDSSSSDESDSASSSSSSSGGLSDDEDDEDPEKYLELARQNVRRRQAAKTNEGIWGLVNDAEEEVIKLDDSEDNMQCVTPFLS
jgi:hypothetical protein